MIELKYPHRTPVRADSFILAIALFPSSEVENVCRDRF
jgi:hypothetical protein